MYQKTVTILSNNLLLFSLLIIVIINLPYFVLGQDFYDIFGYDNLDGNVVSCKILVESGKLFANNSDIIAQPLSGLARIGFPSEFSFIILLNAIFKTHVAYFINILLIQIIAFAGMALLLKKKYNSNNVLLIYTVSLIFSQLNFWPPAGISVAGLPLVLYAYIIFKEKPVLSIFLVLFYASYSILVIVGIFLIAVLSLDVLIKILRKEMFVHRLIFILILCISYVVVEYRLILSVINPAFISNRYDITFSGFGIKETLNSFLNMVFYEYGHNVKKTVLIVFTVIIFISYALFKKIKIGKEISKIIILIFFLSAISAFIQSSFICSLTSRVDILRAIQLQRFYWLLPPLYYILFFVVLEKILNLKFGRVLVITLLLIQFIYVVSANTNWKQVVKTKVLKKEAGVMTYSSYYSEKLYIEIKNFINKDQSSYRVASLGLQPAAALYNGFYTIDGYFGNYPIEYKRSFYRIIKKELEKSKIARDWYIESGGNIVIILSDEMINKLDGHGFVIPTFYKKEKNRLIHHLDINTDVMRNMNCQYIFSAFEIENSNDINLKFEKYFERADSPYGIFLYSIIKKE